MKTKTNKKHMLIYILVILVLAIVAVFLIVGNPFTYLNDKVISSNSYQDEESYGDVSSIFQDQIESYLSSYLANAESNLGYVTEDDMTAITAEITTGVLNSVPANELTEENWEEIRQFVADAVATAMTEYNILNEGDTSQEFELTDEFKNYITSQVVPAITAEYQIYKNDIENLRSSLTKISNEYSKNKASYDTLINNIENSLKTINVDIKRVSDVASSTTEVDNLKTLTANLDTNIKNLTTALTDYKSETAQNFTTVENEIAELTSKINSAIARLEQLTQQQIEDVKTNLKAQIEANSNLLDSQKKEYTEKIDAIQASTSSDLMNAVGQLQNDFAQKNSETTTLLQQSINNLYGGADGNITIKELVTQIQNNADYTDEQKNQLLELINARYGTLESTTRTNIDNVKSDLEQEVENRKQYTDDAIAGLKTSLADQLAQITKDLSDLRNQINLTKDQVGNVKDTLIAKIQANSDLLDSQKQDYITKIEALDASTSTELQQKVSQLQGEIIQKADENATNLTNAITTLYGGADGNVTISELITQIQNSNDYTDEQKTQLVELINSKYGTLETTTKKNIDDVKADLTQEVKDRKQYTDKAVAGLNTTLSNEIATLTKNLSTTDTNLSNTNKDLSSTKTDLSNTKKDLSDTKTTVTDHEKRLVTAETDISNINTSIDSMTTDEWINSFTIKTSDWISSGNKYYYRVSNANIKMTPESDITVNYADSSIQVDSYVQQTGYFDIYVNTVPTGNVVVNYVHIQNRATN